MEQAFKLDGEQIERIIDKLVPLIAAPEDHEFFKGVLFIKAEESTSGQFAMFVNKLLKECSGNGSKQRGKARTAQRLEVSAR